MAAQVMPSGVHSMDDPEVLLGYDGVALYPLDGPWHGAMLGLTLVWCKTTELQESLKLADENGHFPPPENMQELMLMVTPSVLDDFIERLMIMREGVRAIESPSE